MYKIVYNFVLYCIQMWMQNFVSICICKLKKKVYEILLKSSPLLIFVNNEVESNNLQSLISTHLLFVFSGCLQDWRYPCDCVRHFVVQNVWRKKDIFPVGVCNMSGSLHEQWSREKIVGWIAQRLSNVWEASCRWGSTS